MSQRYPMLVCNYRLDPRILACLAFLLIFIAYKLLDRPCRTRKHALRDVLYRENCLHVPILFSLLAFELVYAKVGVFSVSRPCQGTIFHCLLPTCNNNIV